MDNLFERADALESTDPEAAIGLYKRLPKNADAHSNAGRLHHLLGRREEAEAEYRKAVKLNPRLAVAHLNLAIVLHETQRLPESIKEYKTAAKLSPADPDIRCNFALAYEQAGQPRLALRQWGLCAKLAPSGKYAQHARKRVEELLLAEPLKVAWSNPYPSRTPARAKLELA
jgi:tetratricopeptide (TPR) repeat protein